MKELCIFILFSILNFVQPEDGLLVGQEAYSIEGRVFPPDAVSLSPTGNWQVDTRIVVNGGEFLGFLKEDGSFTINNVPSGSYVVEAIHPDFSYEPARVEINSKGKFRARKVVMMVLPLLLIMILPKMMNDPETRKEMEQLNQSMKYDLPEVSEMITSLFSGDEKHNKAKAVKSSKKKQQ